MRTISTLITVLLLLAPSEVKGQTFQLQGSVGPTILDSGHNTSYGFDPGISLSAGAGFSPTRRLTFLLEIERTHRASQLRTDARGNLFGFRGGTLTLAVPQMRIALFRPDRVGPYGIVGFAAGVSRLNESEAFPDRVTNTARALVFGGGIHAPLRGRVSLFIDARMFIGGEANELLAVAPVRAGVGWRF